MEKLDACMQIAPRIRLHSAHAPSPGEPGKGCLSLPFISDNAFGDGSHPTTRLCAVAVDFLSRQQTARKPEWAFLDVGTGTGVLARIARARGAAFVAGTDIDPVALQSAALHARLDEQMGSVRNLVSIVVSAELPDHWGPRFDLVVANILEGPLRGLAAPLSRALAPEGVLLISGFTRIQIPGLRLAFEQAGLKYVNESSLEEWALLMFQKGAGTS